jgi:nucleoid-associated protein YgaU
MGPNIRAAMLISLAFIGAFAWLVDKVSRPLVAIPSPVIRGNRRPGPATSYASRVTRSSIRFQNASVRERQSLEVERGSKRLVVRDEPRVAIRAGMTLPPLSAIARRWARRTIGGAVESASSRPGRASRPNAQDADNKQMAGRDGNQPPRPVKIDKPKPAPEPKRYVVRKGDSLWKIVRSEWKSTDRTLIRHLIQANPQLRGGDRIMAGQTLIIPLKPAGGAASLAAAGGDADPQPKAALGTKTETIRWYTIRKNDSLARIARRELKNARRWPEIVKLNKELDARKPIFAGMRIKLPAT